jgi:nitrite reductase (cytochrome c-552)
MTEYKGSVPYNKHNSIDPLPEGYKYAQPYLKNLFLGYPFSYEYRETCGHTMALADFLNIDRINRYAEKGGLPKTCWNCKTPKMIDWHKEQGDDFCGGDVNELRTQPDLKDHTIGCANCHDPKTMELRLYSVPLQDYLKSARKKFEKLSRNEQRPVLLDYLSAENSVGFHNPQRPLIPGLKPAVQPAGVDLACEATSSVLQKSLQ